MQKLTYEEFSKYLHFHGRTLADGEKKTLFFNWTCSGFSCTFTGKTLKAVLAGLPSPNLFGPDQPDEYPYIGVVADGGHELISRLRVEAGENEYTLFSSEEEGPHTVRVVKLSENMRGKCGASALTADGVFSPCIPAKPALRVEAIGDSITCGYGNEAAAPMAPFLPEEENGWITYVSKACAELNAEFSAVCVSGISLLPVSFGNFPPMPGMEELYEYTDRVYESAAGKTDFTEWDFKTHPVDAVLINLGTNDANMNRLSGDEDENEKRFRAHYADFLKKVRALNGPNACIFCTLGPLDYYLYDAIRDAAAQYRDETGDTRVVCFKYGGTRPWSEQLAAGHPSAAIHERMGRELAARLKETFKL